MAATDALVRSLKKRLDESVVKLNSIKKESQRASSVYDHGSEERKVSELTRMAEAHNEMFNFEMLNVVNRQENQIHDDQGACKVIQNQIENSHERNLDSAVKSLERAMVQCDTAIVQNIEVSAQAVEAIIPALESKLYDRKREMSSSHDSSKLLTSAVEKNYFTMRDGYLELIKKVYEEASVQWAALLRIQEPNAKWHLQKLNKIITDARDSPELQTRREALLHRAQSNLDQYCARSFRRISESKMYHEKETYLQKIEAVKHKVYEYKRKYVQEREQHLNNAEIAIDGFYMTSVEEINTHLHDLQSSLHQLSFYERQLTQFLVLAFKRELKIDRLYRASLKTDSASGSPRDIIKAINASTASISSTTTTTATTTAPPSPPKVSKVARTADSDVIIQLGQKTMEEMNQTFQIGTVLRSMAYSCDLPPEYTEQVLEYVLFNKK